MPNETAVRSVRGAAAVEPFLRPKSVAIIGFSSRAGSAGQNAYNNFILNEYGGDIHLVGRSGGDDRSLAGRPGRRGRSRPQSEQRDPGDRDPIDLKFVGAG